VSRQERALRAALLADAHAILDASVGVGADHGRTMRAARRTAPTLVDRPDLCAVLRAVHADVTHTLRSDVRDARGCLRRVETVLAELLRI
jgi:hypothetical protein